jgi:hypothetical protein
MGPARGPSNLRTDASTFDPNALDARTRDALYVDGGAVDSRLQVTDSPGPCGLFAYSKN